jgi:hypothetical protein
MAERSGLWCLDRYPRLHRQLIEFRLHGSQLLSHNINLLTQTVHLLLLERTLVAQQLMFLLRLDKRLL